jgi:hypothetical protein
MGLENQEQTHFLTRRTNDVGERVAVLFVVESFFKDSTAVVKGTTLKDFLPGRDKGGALDRGYGPYLLTGTTEAPAGYLGFTFAKPKTADAAGEITPFDTDVKHEPRQWPDWMRALYAIEDPDVPYEIVTAGGSTYKNRIFDRVEFYDGGFYESRVTIEKFQSPTKTPPEQLRSLTPVPTRVHWNFMGAGNSLSCLHPKVIIPSQSPNGRLVPNFGTPNARERYLVGDVFPATNLIGWGSYYARDEERFVDGVYYRERETVEPLYIPRPTFI